ncbi:glycosyltransferase family 4 protein [Rubrivirga litoralis]|uniref:Glycosyltransferase family 4 protein n=1 Tax=Rubrivirga litoralis TaxID=3075598 RepID=A0ABU3BTV8_9BACT|nr:glycosyltransferase family 4 protein [Rubrivirga sp. F394]MDT0632675.1 glycosyltransferase family 4 protein [Rubrivirga sp. F394]
MTRTRPPLRLLFVLPAPVRIPMGGAAVVYRHAAGLAARGHEVTVAAPRSAGGAVGLARRGAVWARDRLHGVANAPYHEAAGVRTVEPASPGALDVRSHDAVIATGWQTAPWVAALTTPPRSPPRRPAPPVASPPRPASRDVAPLRPPSFPELGAWGGAGETTRAEGGAVGLYFLQHDERHLSPRAEATWHLGLSNVAVAGWIADEVRAHGAPVVGVVPNAVDPADVALDVPLAERAPRVVALYHRLPVKGPDVLVEALGVLRDLVPGVGADVVSARPPRHRLPEWVDLHVRPPRPALRALYNRAAVCLHTSRVEGWGLVPMEAAACGCAVVATDSRGVSEFLRAGRSMRQVPVGDAAGLAREAADLLRHASRRVEIARAGVEDVARFSWADSTERFEAILRGAVGR